MIIFVDKFDTAVVWGIDNHAKIFERRIIRLLMIITVINLLRNRFAKRNTKHFVKAPVVHG